MSVPVIPSMCGMCTRWQPGIEDPDGVSRCPAFPEGIPPEISQEAWDHREPLRDEKILFELDPEVGEEGLAGWEEMRMKLDESLFEEAIGPEVTPV